jgi:hypothetical protein
MQRRSRVRRCIGLGFAVAAMAAFALDSPAAAQDPAPAPAPPTPPAPQPIPVREVRVPQSPELLAKYPNVPSELRRVDSNSPVHWKNGRVYLIHSPGNAVTVSAGTRASTLQPVQRAKFDTDLAGGRWVEATYQTSSGRLYGWYHFEPEGLCPQAKLTAPQIGAAVSNSNGRTWRDLGIVITAPADTLVCETKNEFFAGGAGDFSVLRQGPYFYFLFTSYAGPLEQQGIGLARLPVSARGTPVGAVAKWHDGSFSQPGVGGSITPVFPAGSSWHESAPDDYWGPSVHWNTHLKRYVMLLNRTQDPEWTQEGIYVSYGTDLDDPFTWSLPLRILPGGSWYPQVIGTDIRRGTDKLAGRSPRLFLYGVSKYRLRFHQP